MIERIDRKYAIIYIDRDSILTNSLKEVDIKDYDGEICKFFDNLKADNYESTMVTEFYNNPGALQWNYYYISNNESVIFDIFKAINENDAYCRKFLVSDIDEFLERTFPTLPAELKCKVTLIKRVNWMDAKIASSQFIKESKELNLIKKGSLYRDISMMNTLYSFDLLRSQIMDTEKHIVFYTHIDEESSLFERKMNFLKENYNTY